MLNQSFFNDTGGCFFMKKYFFVLLVLFSAVCGIYADSDYDPFDKLAEKLLDDFEDDGSTIVVKVFNSDLGNNERKRISKSVQFALYCTNEVEIVDNVEDADYVCTGNIETDGPNYIVSAKLVDNYDGTTVAKARQKVPKNYYAEKPAKVETVIIEKDDDIDADDVLGAVILGSVIGGVFHVITEPHHHVPTPKPAPVPKPRPVPAPRPNRP